MAQKKQFDPKKQDKVERYASKVKIEEIDNKKMPLIDLTRALERLKSRYANSSVLKKLHKQLMNYGA